MSAPLIEFAQFAHPQRWWLRRGTPPWLEEPRWFARAFRISLLLGLMGTVTSWLTVGVMFLLWKQKVSYGGMPFSELLMLVSPGLWFGLGVLLPLSRWLGRGWILTVLSVPVSMAASFAATVVFLMIVDSPKEWAVGFVAGFAGAAIVGAWMGHPLKLSAWAAVAAASLLGSLHCGLFFLFANELEISWLPDQSEVIAACWLCSGFQSLTAVGLGVRLWKPESPPEPRTK